MKHNTPAKMMTFDDLIKRRFIRKVGSKWGTSYVLTRNATIKWPIDLSSGGGSSLLMGGHSGPFKDEWKFMWHLRNMWADVKWAVIDYEEYARTHNLLYVLWRGFFRDEYNPLQDHMGHMIYLAYTVSDGSFKDYSRCEDCKIKLNFKSIPKWPKLPNSSK